MSQKPAQLHGLMDHEAPPTIQTSDLTPELCEAALNLTIDFQRQKQSGANTAILRHPFTISLALLILSVVSYWKCGWIYQRGGFSLMKQNMEEVMGALIISTMIISVVITMATRPTDVLRVKADQTAEDSKQVFGVDLRKFAALKKLDKTNSTKAANTRIVVYRDTPIAVVSLIDVPEMSNTEKFVTRITGAGVRKVYWKSGIIEDLIEWAILRSGQLNTGDAPKILVLMEVLSTDKDLKAVLNQKQFRLIEKRLVKEKFVGKVLKFFGIQYEIYGLGLNVKKVDEVENIKSKAGASGSKTSASKRKT